MLKIRQNIFETNSSSSDYYKEPDYVDGFSTHIEMGVGIIFEATDPNYLKLIQYVVDNDYKKLILDALDNWLSGSDITQMWIDDNSLKCMYTTTADFKVEGKYGGPEYTSYVSAGAFSSEDDMNDDERQAHKEALVYVMQDLQTYIEKNIDDVCSKLGLDKEKIDAWCKWDYESGAHAEFNAVKLDPEQITEDEAKERSGWDSDY